MANSGLYFLAVLRQKSRRAGPWGISTYEKPGGRSTKTLLPQSGKLDKTLRWGQQQSNDQVI